MAAIYDVAPNADKGPRDVHSYTTRKYGMIVAELADLRGPGPAHQGACTDLGRVKGSDFEVVESPGPNEGPRAR
jgi:hypothetical protein